MFIPPINMGQFQPSPATMSQWIYQIWQFLQENPIATETEIREFIQSELTQSETLGTAIEEYLTENPPSAPVQSVQGKTGAVQLAYNDIVTSSNAVPVYKAASTPSTNTLTGQYNLGYRLFVNTTNQEIYTISPAGALSLVGRGSFDGTTVDLNTSQGDTTIAEAITEVNDSLESSVTPVQQTYTVMSGYSSSDDTYNYVATVGKVCIFHINVIATSSRAPENLEFVIKGLPAPAHGQMFFGFVSDGSTALTPARMAVIQDGLGDYGIRFHYPVGVTLTNNQAVVMAGSYITV